MVFPFPYFVKCHDAEENEIRDTVVRNERKSLKPNLANINYVMAQTGHKFALVHLNVAEVAEDFM